MESTGESIGLCSHIPVQSTNDICRLCGCLAIGKNYDRHRLICPPSLKASMVTALRASPPAITRLPSIICR